ncbi:MAG: alpha/beta hydrolase [Nostocoides sp.]
MTDTILDGITTSIVDTARLRTQVLERGSAVARRTVVFIHGNVSSSLFWQPTMLSLPDDVRALAIDLRGFGGSQALPVDATNGLGDYAADVASVLQELDLGPVDLVGWSMGGGVVLQLLLDQPQIPVSSLVLVNPVSPYGFGGTDAVGVRLTLDGAGTGGGCANPDFVTRLAEGDTGTDSPTSPRNVLLGAYVASGHTSEFEDLWVTSMLTTVTGEDHYPGNSRPSEHWPGFAAGDRGVLNTMSPVHFNVSGIVGLEAKPPLLWVRGLNDAIVSDASLFDVNHLGVLGVIPDWPGQDLAPAQPMVSQTRTVLAEYQAAGGLVREVAIPDCGHSPHLEHPEVFREALLAHLAVA